MSYHENNQFVQGWNPTIAKKIKILKMRFDDFQKYNENNVLYLNLAVRFKYSMQQFVFKFSHSPYHHHNTIVHPSNPTPIENQHTI